MKHLPLCLRQPTRSAFFRPGIRSAATAIGLIVGLFALSLAAAAVEPVIVYQPGAGQCNELYVPSSQQKIVLLGTEKMSSSIIGDLDADGIDDDLVYADSVNGGMGFYEIPGDGVWHPELDHRIPPAPEDGVPLAVVRTGGAGSPSVLIYNSDSASGTFAMKADGTIAKLSTMERAYAVDVQGRGYKGDLVWYTQAVGLRWREGYNGLDHPNPWNDGSLVPLGGGKILSAQPTRAIAFYARYAGGIYVCDRNWAWTPIWGTAWTWCTNPGSALFGDADGDGFCELVFVKSATDPLRWYNVPASGGAWSQSGLVTDYSVECGWGLRGVAEVDVSGGPQATRVGNIADLRNLADGTEIELAAKPRTKLVRELDSSNKPVTTGYYIEEPDRSAGIRVTGSTQAAANQFVSVKGTLATLNGERVIEAAGETLEQQTSVIAPIAADVADMYATPQMTGLLVQTSGAVTSGDASGRWFMLDDGAGRTVKVYCPDITSVSGNVKVTGCVGAEKDWTGSVTPVVRVETAADITQVINPEPPPPPPPNPNPANFSLWTQSCVDKVFKSDPTQPLKSYAISAARNEHEAFQIVLRADKTQLSSVAVSTSDLVSTAGTIAASDVAVYKPTYIYLPSYSKEYPDPLPPYQGAFSLAMGQTQPLWIDVYVPKSAPAGDYSGSVTITTSNAGAAEVPFTLHVYNFTLPDESKVATAFGLIEYYLAPKEGVTYGSAESKRLHKAYYEFLLSRGICPSDIPVDLLSAEADSYLKDPRMTAFTIPYIADRTYQSRILDKIRAAGVWDKGFFSLVDEVGDKASYDRYIQQAAYVRSIDPNVNTLVTYYTRPNWTSSSIYDVLGPYVNTWCPMNGDVYDVTALDKERAGGDRVWYYFCLSPNFRYPNVFVQYPGIMHRLLIWDDYLYNATGLLYWCTDYWQETADPWTDINTGQKSIPGAPLYGEGSLLYPGKKVGVDGPVSSIRLEILRDGLEDYKYMWLLEKKIGRSGVLSYVRQVTPTWTSFTNDSSVLQGVRDDIARRIEN